MPPSCDAIGVSDDLGGIAGEFDPGLCGGRRAAVDPLVHVPHRGVEERDHRDAVDARRDLHRSAEVAYVLRRPSALALLGHMAGARRLPPPKAIGVGLPHGVASDGLELGVHDHHRDVEVVADEVRAAQTQPPVAFVAHVGVVEVHHELSDLEGRAGAEVDLQQVAVERVGERVDRVHVGAEPPRRL